LHLTSYVTSLFSLQRPFEPQFQYEFFGCSHFHSIALWFHCLNLGPQPILHWHSVEGTACRISAGQWQAQVAPLEVIIPESCRSTITLLSSFGQRNSVAAVSFLCFTLHTAVQSCKSCITLYSANIIVNCALPATPTSCTADEIEGMKARKSPMGVSSAQP